MSPGRALRRPASVMATDAVSPGVLASRIVEAALRGGSPP